MPDQLLLDDEDVAVLALDADTPEDDLLLSDDAPAAPTNKKLLPVFLAAGII